MSLLLDAVSRQDRDEVNKLLAAGADVNAELEGEWVTVLDEAAYWGHYEMVELLLHHGAHVDTPVRLDTRKTIFQTAVSDGYEEIVQLMMEKEANIINAPAGEIDGRTALQAAAEYGLVNLVKLLIEKNADVNAPAGKINGCTALQAAAGSGDETLAGLLIKAEANVNAPAGEICGRTALQAAAGSGNETLVELLIKAKANVNAPAGEIYGRTALQVAVERGNEALVELLIKAKANVNAPAGEIYGRTALQAAAERGNKALVELLIKAKANVNAPAGEKHGKSALRAAIDVGYDSEEEEEGEEGGEKENDDREDMESNKREGVKSEAEEKRGDKEGEGGGEKDEKENKMVKIVEILLKEGAIVHETKDDSGRNALHIVCQRGQVRLLETLLEKSTPQALNAKDISGSTPLHLAVRLKKQSAVEYLIKKNVDLEIKDTLGRTPLHVDFQKSSNDTSISKLLLQKGARVNGLLLDHLPRLWKICDKTSRNMEDIVILHEDLDRGTYIADVPENLLDWKNSLFNSPSICFRSSPAVDKFTSFVQPSEFLKECPEFDSGVLGAQWGWSTVSEKGVVNFAAKIPDPQDIISVMPAEVVLVGYACFNCPIQQPKTHSQGRVTRIPQFKITRQKVEISWIMKQEKGASFLRSVHYRGSLNLPNIAIPQSTVHFVTLFLDDIRGRWKKIIESAKLHLSDRRDAQLGHAGKERDTIRCLLSDSQEWSELRKIWQENHDATSEFLAQLKEQDILVSDVIDRWDFRKYRQSKTGDQKKKEQKKREQKTDNTEKQGAEAEVGNPKGQTAIQEGTEKPPTGDSKGVAAEQQKPEESKAPDSSQEPNLKTVPTTGKPQATTPETQKPATIEGQKVEAPKGGGTKPVKPAKMEELKDMKKLLGAFGTFRTQCEKEITQLENDSNKMIELEFSLISIFEARRSIEASMSMKRLSWITFIFLPLMFISGLFGMNVNILQNGGPAWQWYFVVVVPFSVLVILVWILCKYLRGIKSFEKRLDKFLRSAFGYPENGREQESAGQQASDKRSLRDTSKSTIAAEISTGARPLYGFIRKRFNPGGRSNRVDEEQGSGSQEVIEENLVVGKT